MNPKGETFPLTEVYCIFAYTRLYLSCTTFVCFRGGSGNSVGGGGGANNGDAVNVPNLIKAGASRKQYQRILHESYQYLVKFIADQQAAEESKLKRKKGSGSGIAGSNNNAS